MKVFYLYSTDQFRYMSDIIKFNYEGHEISFEFSDGNKMIHANQMAKPFGKRIDNFLRLKETKEYF